LRAEEAQADADSGAEWVVQEMVGCVANGIEAGSAARGIRTQQSSSRIYTRAHRTGLIEQDVDIQGQTFALELLADARKAIGRITSVASWDRAGSAQCRARAGWND
jgi:hypothetical protein